MIHVGVSPPRFFRPETRVLFFRQVFEAGKELFGQLGPALRIKLQCFGLKFVDAHGKDCNAGAFNWGAAKLKRLADIERDVVVVRIGDARVLDGYADLSTLTKSNGWALFHGKNDLWVGAAAFATESHLLTIDDEFLPLRGCAGWQVTVRSLLKRTHVRFNKAGTCRHVAVKARGAADIDLAGHGGGDEGGTVFM